MKIGNLEVYGIIYKITNKINGKVYIGQTTVGFKLRYDSTKWWTKTHNEHLKSSVEKYGVDNFEVSEFLDVAFSKDELDTKEIMYINMFKSDNRLFGYNKKSGGANGKHTKESLLKMSRAHKGINISEETKLKMSKVRQGTNIGENNPMYGKNPLRYLSKEKYDELMKVKSDNMKGENNPMFGAYGDLNPFYGKTHTEETRDIISKKAKNRYEDRLNNPNSKPIKMCSYNYSEIYVFDSFRSCSEWLVDKSIIKNVRTGMDAIGRSIKNEKDYKGYIFCYISKEEYLNSQPMEKVV